MRAGQLGETEVGLLRLYKLISKKWGIFALQDQQLKVSPINELNDPFEYLSIDLGDRSIREWVGFRRGALGANSAVLCFSAAWRNPVIWAHYADSHRGMALGFDIPGRLLYQMEYSDKKIKADPKKLDDPDEEKAILDKMARRKYKHWEYEEEYRLLIDLTRVRREAANRSEHDFFSFGEGLVLREVVLGCRYVGGENSALERQLLNEGVAITTARPAFRTFRMAIQQNDTLKKRL